MTDFLHWFRDPIFANVVGILSVVIALATYLRRRGKSIRMRVVGDFPLIRTYGGFAKLVKIDYNGISLQNARFLVVKIENDGREPIRSADIEAPLTVNRGPAASVISHSITGKHPHDLEVEPSIDTGSIRLAVPLLNSGDRFEVSCIVADAKKDITIEGRIAGLTLARLEHQHRRVYIAFVLVFMIGMLYTLSSVGYLLHSLYYQPMWKYAVRLAYNIGFASYLWATIFKRLLRCQYE